MATMMGVALLALFAPAVAQETSDREGMEFFERRIRPVLVERCHSCHSAEARKLKGGLRLDSRDALLKGGETGPSIVPGDPEKSLLIKAIRRTDPDLKMPPKESEWLSPGQIADFEAWVKRGAPDPRATAAEIPVRPAHDFAAARKAWPFAPLSEPRPPAVRDASWTRNDVDRFILAKLEERGLRPGADADRRALLRRATFDLIGLPPTPAELDAFLADASPDAFARVVERLLASPHYGERWGRHWLDVVRYADTAGDNSDYPVPQHWRYRNYVIAAFNRDLPYDRFIREQVSGDLMPSASEEERQQRLIATGYLANSRRFGSRVDDYPWHLTIEDTIDNLGRTFLGLTVNCARCHDHKFDPISNEDYYALYGFFSSTKYPWPGIELEKFQRDFVPLVPAAQVDEMMKPVREKKAELEARIKTLEEEKSAADKSVKELDAAKDAGLGEAKKKASETSKALEKAKKDKESHARRPLPFEVSYAVSEGKSISNARMQLKGDPERPGKEVARRWLTVLGGQELAPGSAGSGRLQLAEWLADPANPLTARVMANRIWAWHFGRGIVSTPSDFGRQGRPPTHPELLDWLTRRFVEGGWSIKAMHRLIMSSRAYRLSSRDIATNAAQDPSNDGFWKFNRRRLEAEELRDALLAVSGALDRTPDGKPHPFPPMSAWDYTQHKPFIAVYETDKRSVYLMTQRVKKHPFYAIFDGADPSASTPIRLASTTPLQALYLMNDPFFHQQAKKLAARLAAEAPEESRRLELASLLLHGRPITPDERALAESYLEGLKKSLGPEGAWESYARVLLRTGEFVHVP